jgi:hypothetical protein
MGVLNSSNGQAVFQGVDHDFSRYPYILICGDGFNRKRIVVVSEEDGVHISSIIFMSITILKGKDKNEQ